MRRIAALLFVLFSSVVGFAQNGSATLTGYVQDPGKAFIPGVSVVAINTATNQRFEAKTGKDGGYNITGLPVGSYRMEIEKPAFKTIVREDMFLHVQDTLQINFEMAVGSTSESVTVNGSKANMNTTDASVSTVIDQDFVANIPLNGRSFQSLLTALPGVSAVPTYQGQAGYSGEITVNGQRTESNYYTVDGVSANVGNQAAIAGQGATGNIPNETATGTTQSIIPLDALEEFRGFTSSYSAAYGRGAGGAFLFNSRSGANTLHGDLYDYVRSGALDANNTFNKFNGVDRQSESQNDFGGFLGGPVTIPHIYDGRDKTFFFFAYEGVRLTVPTASTTFEVPNAATRAAAPAPLQQLLSTYPLARMEAASDKDLGTGFYQIHRGWSLPASQDTFSLRLDHDFGSHLKVFARLGRSTSEAQSRPYGVASILSIAQSNSQTATIGAVSATNGLINDFRVNMTGTHFIRSMYWDGFDGSTPMHVTDVPGMGPNDWFLLYITAGSTSQNYVAPTSNRQRQLNLVDVVTKSWGHHTAQAGVDFRQINSSAPLPHYYQILSYASAPGLSTGANSGSSAYVQGQSSIKPVYDNFSAFVQDEWKVSHNLDASLGVRWDVNPAPHDAAGLGPYTLDQISNPATSVLAPRGTPLWNTRWNNLAPRVGLAYSLRNGTGAATVIRAGAGIFYDNGNSSIGNAYMNSIGISGIDTSIPTTGGVVSAATLFSLPGPSLATPYKPTVTGFDHYAKSPYAEEYNLSVEQAFGPKTSLTLGYIGSVGRAQVTRLNHQGLPGTNLSYSSYVTVVSEGSSNYNSLQAKVEQRLSHGLQLVNSFTWSRNIDNASGNFLTYGLVRGNADTDIRNSFQTALTYDAPSNFQNAIARHILGHWSFDGRISARSALPLNFIAGYSTIVGFGYVPILPYQVPGQPLYVYGTTLAHSPSGRAYNPKAFSTIQQFAGQQIIGRNLYRAYDAVQADLAIRRDLHLRDKVGLQLRVEAFNVLNHPIYGTIQNLLTSSQFGIVQNTENNLLGGLSPLYQEGGPRTLQVAAKLHF